MNKNKIQQFNVAKNHALYPWKNFLKDRYNFKDYHDSTKPCFFFGVWGEEELINNHQDLKVVQFITPFDCSMLKNLIPKNNLFVIEDPHFDNSIKYKYNIKNIKMEFKDYSIFKPKVLGDKIYCYMRDPSEFKKSITDNLQNFINYEILYGGLQTDARFYSSMISLKENYYDKCFLNLNLSGRHGLVTAREFGFMGVKTIIYDCKYDFPSLININNLDLQEIISIINLESRKIGTVQPAINCHNVDDSWLNEDFWI